MYQRPEQSRVEGAEKDQASQSGSDLARRGPTSGTGCLKFVLAGILFGAVGHIAFSFVFGFFWESFHWMLFATPVSAAFGGFTVPIAVSIATDSVSGEENVRKAVRIGAFAGTAVAIASTYLLTIMS